MFIIYKIYKFYKFLHLIERKFMLVLSTLYMLVSMLKDNPP